MLYVLGIFPLKVTAISTIFNLDLQLTYLNFQFFFTTLATQNPPQRIQDSISKKPQMRQ